MKKMTLAFAILLSNSFAIADLMPINQFVLLGNEADRLAQVIQNINGKTKDGGFEANAKVYCYKRPNSTDMRCSIDIAKK